MSEALALAALDVAGAPAQTANIVKPGDSVLILGAGGKSGMLCGYEAMKRVGPAGNVVGMSRNDKYRDILLDNKLVHKYFVADAASPVEVLEKALEANDGKEYDVAINVVNIPGTEMSTILPCAMADWFTSLAWQPASPVPRLVLKAWARTLP